MVSMFYYEENDSLDSCRCATTFLNVAAIHQNYYFKRIGMMEGVSWLFIRQTSKVVAFEAQKNKEMDTGTTKKDKYHHEIQW